MYKVSITSLFVIGEEPFKNCLLFHNPWCHVVSLYSNLRHKNIVQLVGLLFAGTSLQGIVMEMMSKVCVMFICYVQLLYTSAVYISCVLL